MTDHLIERKITCLYPCGTTGEMMYLTVEERKHVAETVVRQADGRVPVFIQVGAWNQKDTIELARHACEIGADGIGVVTPVFYKIDDEGLIRFFTEVAGSVPADFPVYLYGIKQNAVNDINPLICTRVVERCPNVIGAKYSYPDMTMMQELMNVNDGQFKVLAGPDHLFTALCSMGGAGVVSGNANAIPEHYAAIWKAIGEGDFHKAARLQKRTNDLNSILCRVNNISAYKVVLKKEKVIRCSSMRAPLTALTEEQETELMKELEKADYKRI